MRASGRFSSFSSSRAASVVVPAVTTTTRRWILKLFCSSHRQRITIKRIGVFVVVAVVLLLLLMSSGRWRSALSSSTATTANGADACVSSSFTSSSNAFVVRARRYALVNPKERRYASNHWFHVAEFHAHAHSRLRERRRRKDTDNNNNDVPLVGDDFGGGEFSSAAAATKTTTKTVALTVPSETFLRTLSPTTRFLLAVSYCEEFKDENGCEEVMFTFTDERGKRAEDTFVVSRTRQSLRRRFVENFRESSAASSLALCAMEGNGGKGVDAWNGMVEVVNVEPPENYAYARGDGNDDDGENKMNGAAEKTLYEGSFGGMHVDRGAWMPNAGDSESIREAIKNVCSPPRHSSFSLDDDDDDQGAENANSDSLDGCLRIASQIRKHDESRRIKTSDSDRSSSSSSSSSHDSSGSGISSSRSNGNSRGEEVKLALVYNRNAGRAIDDVQSVRAKLEELLNLSERKRRHGTVSRWRVLVLTHDEKNPPCLLSKCVGSASLVLTPHGFQSMLAVFMSENALLYEAFPSRYYKHGYKRLALEFNLAYGYSQSKPVGFVSKLIAKFFTTDACMKMYYCRYLSRKASVDVDDGMIARIVHAAVSMQTEEGEDEEEGGEDEAHLSSPIFVLPNRVQCNWRCAGEAGCQKFTFDERSKTCKTRIDRYQKEHATAGGDVIGRGIYDQKCVVLGCR